jgi:TetR/AcrR family fatty acid metabolism transcriptional regulator
MTSAARAPSLKERQRQEREDLILEATASLLAEKGYHETSIEDIAARVGTSKGTIYLHFASKEDLVVALMARGMRFYSQAMEAAMAEAGMPRQKVQALFDHVYASMSSEGFKVVRSAFASPEIHSRLAEKRDELREAFERSRRYITAVLEEGKALGEFDPTMPTPVMATLLSSLTNPMSYHTLVVEEHMPVEDVVRYVSRFFFKGVAVEPSKGE